MPSQWVFFYLFAHLNKQNQNKSLQRAGGGENLSFLTELTKRLQPLNHPLGRKKEVVNMTRSKSDILDKHAINKSYERFQKPLRKV